MSENNLQFKISSALKNIIGKDLITNKYIAIFELVKNSFDAYAENAELIFNDDRIVIKDDGKGMDYEDIKDKWLFVAYSAKADDSEDRNYGDYRRKINKRKSFAGAKGVGRFACDRLGTKLKLISIKEKAGAKIESIEVFWESFEEDPKDHFIDIKVKHTTLQKNPYPDIKHGTILEITGLRENWTQDDIDKLNGHLAKLINPIQEQKDDHFNISIIFDGKKEVIENFVFDKLALKTTQITSNISSDGKFITTEVIDRGEKIYKVKEKNLWKEDLSDIDVRLFYLSKPTKISFKHFMGVESVNFGSVFVYKNGFRVFPFGEVGDDSLSIDKRKGQGFKRFLGTRDVIGFIEIRNAKEENFKETSSRDGGLIETKAYKDLKEYFFKNILRRLEAYVVDTLDWTYVRETETEIFPEKKKAEILKLIKRLTESDNFVDIEYGYSLPEKIEKKTKDGFRGALGQLTEEAKKTGDEKLLKAVKKIEEVQRHQKRELELAEKQKDVAEDRASAMMRVTKQDFKNLVSYHHQIGISALTVGEYISKIFKQIKAKDYSKIEQYLQKIKKENDKINSIARFASGSGMKENATKKERSLPNFIANYIEDDYKGVASGDLNISVDNKCKDFIIPFRPFDISVVLDNLISNSRKAKAKKVDIKLTCDKNSFDLTVEDDGNGLDSNFRSDPSQIFEAKTSTTNGSGWGLFHVKETLESLGATIKVYPQKKGLKFIATFKKIT
jgi:GH24 family phage-related lysozyme (muramidase)